jgi:hypothetical protein
VDQIEVDVVEAQPRQALLEFARGTHVRGQQLGRHEHLLAREAASLERGAHALLVAIQRGRVDVAIAGFQRPLYGLLGLASGGHLPDA